MHGKLNISKHKQQILLLLDKNFFCTSYFNFSMEQKKLLQLSLLVKNLNVTC